MKSKNGNTSPEGTPKAPETGKNTESLTIVPTSGARPKGKNGRFVRDVKASPESH